MTDAMSQLEKERERVVHGAATVSPHDVIQNKNYTSETQTTTAGVVRK